jgi:hypothetical protein
MTRRAERDDAAPATYSGEIWTDARGYATASLPDDAASLQPPLEHALEVLDGRGEARIATALKDGRFTIETDEPHTKVAWRVAGRPAPTEAQPLESAKEER